MPHTLMKQLTEMKLTGMEAALSSQMDQPDTYEELTFRESDWRCWSHANHSKGISVNRNACYKKPG